MKAVIITLTLGTLILHPGYTEETQPSVAAEPDCLDQKHMDTTQIRATELIGSAVRTSDATGLGQIQDFVFDLNTGRIQFALVGKRDGIGPKQHVTADPMASDPCRIGKAVYGQRGPREARINAHIERCRCLGT